jgi:hypothetical protein
MPSVELGRSANCSLEALPDTGTAPSHRSEGNVEDGAGAWAWVTLCRRSSAFLQQLRPFRYLLRLENFLSPDSAIPWYNPTTAESVCIVLFACA